MAINNPQSVDRSYKFKYKVLGIDFHRYIYGEGETIEFLETEIPDTGLRKDIVVRVDGKYIQITEFMATPLSKEKKERLSDYHISARIDPENNGMEVRTDVYSIAEPDKGVDTIKLDRNLSFKVETTFTKNKNAWKVLSSLIDKTIKQEELTVEESIDFLILQDMELDEELDMPIENLMSLIIFFMGRAFIPNDLKAKIALCEMRVLARFFDGDKLAEMIGMLKTEIRNSKIASIIEEYGPGFDVIYGDGVADGMAEGKLEDARNFLAEGFSEDVISRCTGVSIDKLRELKRKL